MSGKKRVMVPLPAELIEKLDRYVPKGKRSAYIAEKLLEEMRREDLLRSIELIRANGPMWKAEDHPEWPGGDSSEWIRELRREADQRIDRIEETATTKARS